MTQRISHKQPYKQSTKEEEKVKKKIKIFLFFFIKFLFFCLIATFIPKKGESYTLKVLSPSGVTFNNPLPSVIDQGANISSSDNLYSDPSNIVLRLSANIKGNYTVTLSKKFEIIKQIECEIKEEGESKEIVFLLILFYFF